MIVVKLQGGMGNQMFQYALARRLADERGDDVGLDLRYLLDRMSRPSFVFRDYDLDLFRIRARALGADEAEELTRIRYPQSPYSVRTPLRQLANGWRRLRRQGAFSYVSEKAFHFDPTVLGCRGNLYLDGYWQSPRYFSSIEYALKEELQLREELPVPVREMAARIGNVNSVCLNVRRADFVQLKTAYRYHGVCDIDYFGRALEILVGKIGAPEIFITSDDIPWCRDNIRFPYPIAYLDREWTGPRFSHYLALMTHCRHFIIPNSTFAW